MTSDREVFARKEKLREKDRRTVAAGEATWAEMNRANTFAASVVHLYRPIKKLGLPKENRMSDTCICHEGHVHWTDCALAQADRSDALAKAEFLKAHAYELAAKAHAALIRSELAMAEAYEAQARYDRMCGHDGEWADGMAARHRSVTTLEQMVIMSKASMSRRREWGADAKAAARTTRVQVRQARRATEETKAIIEACRTQGSND